MVHFGRPATIDEVEVNYPIFKDSLPQDVVDRIRNDFPGVSDKDLGEKAEQIVLLYESVKTYELFQVLKEEASQTGLMKSQEDGYMGTPLRSAEFWLLFWNSGMKDGTERASKEALTLAQESFPNEGLWLTRGDGFRHALWNSLIAKYTGQNHDNVSDAVAWAQKFTDAHENGNPAPSDVRDNAMDFHNNAEGRRYFSSVAWVNKFKSFWLFVWHYGYDVYAPETNVIKSQLHTKTLQGAIFSNNSQLPSLTGKIVWIQ